MQRILIVALLLLTVAGCSTTKQATLSGTMEHTACADTGLTLLQKDELGQRGCCSWHGGVCGCSGGSVVCCDNTYSPTCSCKTDDKPTVNK